MAKRGDTAQGKGKEKEGIQNTRGGKRNSKEDNALENRTQPNGKKRHGNSRFSKVEYGDIH